MNLASRYGSSTANGDAVSTTGIRQGAALAVAESATRPNKEGQTVNTYPYNGIIPQSAGMVLNRE